jgi:hypothetical protein
VSPGPIFARSPDGREWEIRIRRVRVPPAPESQFDPSEHASDLLSSVLAYAIAAPVMWFVIPGIRFAVRAPVALVRATRSPIRWVVAESDDLAPITIAWRTTSASAEAVALAVGQRLSNGYAELRTVPDAVLTDMSEPPGTRDVA